MRRTDRFFDVILLGFVDSWAAVASGGLSLSENHLYTVEAFRAYHDRLTPDGMLVILRWDVDIPRLVANAVALLGAEEAGKRILVLLEKRGTEKEPPQMIFALRRRPFTDEETAQVMTLGERAARHRAGPARGGALRRPLRGPQDHARSSWRKPTPGSIPSPTTGPSSSPGRSPGASPGA